MSRNPIRHLAEEPPLPGRKRLFKHHISALFVTREGHVLAARTNTCIKENLGRANADRREAVEMICLLARICV